jgi:hypothetical protein
MDSTLAVTVMSMSGRQTMIPSQSCSSAEMQLIQSYGASGFKYMICSCQIAVWMFNCFVVGHIFWLSVDFLIIIFWTIIESIMIGCGCCHCTVQGLGCTHNLSTFIDGSIHLNLILSITG